MSDDATTREAGELHAKLVARSVIDAIRDAETEAGASLGIEAS